MPARHTVERKRRREGAGRDEDWAPGRRPRPGQPQQRGGWTRPGGPPQGRQRRRRISSMAHTGSDPVASRGAGADAIGAQQVIRPPEQQRKRRRSSTGAAGAAAGAETRVRGRY
jgi:hypothetical protein